MLSWPNTELFRWRRYIIWFCRRDSISTPPVMSKETVWTIYIHCRKMYHFGSICTLPAMISAVLNHNNYYISIILWAINGFIYVCRRVTSHRRKWKMCDIPFFTATNTHMLGDEMCRTRHNLFLLYITMVDGPRSPPKNTLTRQGRTDTMLLSYHNIF